MCCARPLRILVTDDDPIQLRASARLLRTLGHSGALAPSGHIALDLLAQQAFDVLLLDLRMPDLDGLETLKRLRPNHPALRVVMVSGDDLSVDWAFYQRAGADGSLVKPLDDVALSAILKRWF